MGTLKKKRFVDFWPAYVRAHQDARNRKMHFLGTGGALIILMAAIMTRQWLLLLAVPIWGYGWAWIGHFYYERNRPAAFGSPIWAFRGDLRMFILMLFGAMRHEMKRLEIDQSQASGTLDQSVATSKNSHDPLDDGEHSRR